MLNRDRWFVGPLRSTGLLLAFFVLELSMSEPALTQSNTPNVQLTSSQAQGIELLEQVRPNSPQRVFLFTDPNKDPDDLCVLIETKYLQEAGFVDLRCVITTLGDREIRTKRAQFTRSVLEALGIGKTRVGVGVDYDVEVKATDGTVDLAATAGRRKDHQVFMDTPLLRPHAQVEPDALVMMKDELERMPDHSVVFLINAGMADAAAILRSAPELTQRKLAKVVAMGGVESQLDARGFVIADKRAYNNSTHQPSADYLYASVQELRVPLVVVSKEAAYSTAVPRSFFDSLAATQHPVGIYLKNQQKQSLHNLWNGICEGHLPPALTAEWFFQTFTDIDGDSQTGKDAIAQARSNPRDFESIWDHVIKFNLYDPLALLAATPGATDLLFESRVPDACRSDTKIIGQGCIKNAALLQELLTGMGIRSLSAPQSR
jgi:hypothetical protein